MIKKLLSTANLSEETQKYLEKFSRKYSLSSILESLENLSSLKVLVIGEAIIDDYQFGTTIGKSAKSPIIALRHTRGESYPGGSLAIANHLAGFCKEVGLLAMLGEQKSYAGFIKSHLKINVKPTFIYKKDSPTIVKRRFLEDGTFHKLLEFYDINSSELNTEQTRSLIKKLKLLMKKYDLVVCADFGHGMLNKTSREILTKNAKFLSVNTQANAENFGYHTVSAYSKANLLCLDERELRLEYQTKHGELLDIAKGVLNRVRADYMIITHGSKGSIGFKNRRDKEIYTVPSMAVRDIDSVGAGDAFFAITSALIYNDVPLEVACFVGNTVGALAINIIGNKESVTKKDLTTLIKNILS